MEKIKVKWAVNISQGYETFTLEELGVESIEDWNNLSEEDQKEIITDAIDTLDQPVFMVVDEWKRL